MQDIISRYGDNTGSAIGRASVPVPRRLAREVARAVHQQHGRGVVMAARVNAGAHVARTALINVALLSREEEQLISLAPLGEYRYKAIVDAYAIFAAGVLGEL
jgi:hypothetical protein